MKNIQLFIISFFICLSFPLNILAQSFYDNVGKPILYYNLNNNTLFDYTGNPRFYFTFDNLSKISMYNFEGRHIAWLSDGILYDHDGKILATQRDRIINITYALEPIKPIEKIVPLKKIEQLPPIQPILKYQYSTLSLLSDAYNNSSNQTSLDFLQNDYTAVVTRKPYELPVDEIYNTIKVLNENHNRLIAQGYIYDATTDNYLTKNQFAELQAKRKVVAKSYYDVIKEAKNTSSYNFNFKNPRKKTWYSAYFGNPELGVHPAKVLIKKSGKVRGFYFTHPKYGYMFYGLYGNPKVTFPFTEVSFIGNISKQNVGLLGSSYIKGSGTIFWHRGLTKIEK